MEESQLGILLAGISSILGVLVYFTKNIKESKCCGASCKQRAPDGRCSEIRQPRTSIV